MAHDTSATEIGRLAEELARATDAAGAVVDKQRQLNATRAVLDATLDALADGVLVVEHESRAVSLFNRRFAEMWQIPSEVLASKDDNRLLGSVVKLLADPDEFFARVGYLYEHPTDSSREDVSLVDGRIFDRYSAPVLASDGRVLGRVWFFHDATQRHRDQAQRLAAERRAAVAQVEREIAIARRIQTSILPKNLRDERYEIAGSMLTASAIGGDYYDLRTTPDGRCWLAIGDVSGHGLNAGLIMLMLQSGVAALVERDPQGAPRDVVRIANRMLYENVWRRLDLRDFITLTILRIDPDGRVELAGAHEVVLIWRAATRTCEQIATPGAWVGAMPEVEAHVVTTTARLGPGDVMLLYTDGITEARNARGEQYGFDRLTRTLEAHASAASDEICAHILASVSQWTSRRDDDQTVLAVRFRG